MACSAILKDNPSHNGITCGPPSQSVQGAGATPLTPPIIPVVQPQAHHGCIIPSTMPITRGGTEVRDLNKMNTAEAAMTITSVKLGGNIGSDM